MTDRKTEKAAKFPSLTEESLLTVNVFCLINITDLKVFGIFLGSY